MAGAEQADLTDRVTDERQGAAICYTTGTTGNPKGVFYSHRSTWLHSNAATSTTTFGLSEADRVLPVVPMFHANAWGLAYAAGLAGASMVMPGPDLSPKALLELLENEKVTVTAGVPTIWMGMVPLLEGRDLSSLRMIVCGGSAVPRSLSEAWRERIGLPITQAWGMTETSPIASVCTIRSEYADAGDDELADLRATAGIAPPGVELRIVDSDTREPLPWDGVASGELEARGPWVAKQYFRTDEPGEQFSRGRLAAHRRRRHHLRARLRPAGRPHQGPRQVRRRVDQLGRAGERDHGPPEDRRGRGDRGAAPEVVRAAAGVRRGQGRARSSPATRCWTSCASG